MASLWYSISCRRVRAAEESMGRLVGFVEIVVACWLKLQ